MFFLFSFGLSRAFIALSPIFVGTLLSPVSYVQLELWWGLSLAFLPFLTIGQSSLIPMVRVGGLSRLDLEIPHTILLKCLVLAFFCISIVLKILDSELLPYILILNIASLSTFLASKFKSVKRRSIGALCEAIPWVFILTAVYIQVLAEGDSELYLQFVFVQSCLLSIYFLWLTPFSIFSFEIDSANLRLFLIRGLQVMVLSGCVTIVSQSMRLIPNFISVLELDRDFFFLLRASSVSLIAHQLFASYFFIRIHQIQLGQSIVVALGSGIATSIVAVSAIAALNYTGLLDTQPNFSTLVKMSIFWGLISTISFLALHLSNNGSGFFAGFLFLMAFAAYLLISLPRDTFFYAQELLQLAISLEALLIVLILGEAMYRNFYFRNTTRRSDVSPQSNH